MPNLSGKTGRNLPGVCGPAGCSEHETGLAIDLALAGEEPDFIRPPFPDRGICRRFRQRCADFGFVLRYPAGKETVTGIAHEPWHFRYVGVPTPP